jgi:hypothetical protein
MKFQAYFFSRSNVNTGWIGASVEHHVERTLPVDAHLKNDFVLVKLEGNFDNLLFAVRLCETAETGHRQQ